MKNPVGAGTMKDSAGAGAMKNPAGAARMNLKEHDYEPVHGLPAPLPEGETILWQGAPCWHTLARRALRVRLVSVYFVALIAWGISGNVSAGDPASEVAVSALRLAGLGAAAVGVLALFAWLVARSTVYTITTRRVVLRFGIALPITLQVPYALIDAAGMHLWPNGAGDLALTLRPGEKISYLIVWPHVRPWKFARPQPMLRCIPDAAAVSQVLGRALAASAAQPAQPMPSGVAAGDRSLPVPAAA